MFFKSNLASKYLAAAIAAALLQGAAIASPVFAEAAAKSDAVITQDAANEQTADATNKQTAGTAQKETANSAKSKAKAKGDKSSVETGTPEYVIHADHSAEFKPVQNEFLKEGEGIPGSEVPSHGVAKMTKEELAEEKAQRY